MVYRFIDNNKEDFGVRWLLRRFSLSTNAYYNYLKNRKAEYRKNKASVQRRIVEIYHKNDGVPGYRMIRDYLVMEGIIYSYPTIFKYTHELGLHSIVRPKKPAYKKGTANQVFADLVNREFHAKKTNEVWCTDFIYAKAGWRHAL